MYGQEGDDTIDGGNHDDTLHGGAGQDELTGGAGNDLYVFSHSGSANADEIQGFGDEGNNVIGLDEGYFDFATGSLTPGDALTDGVDIFERSGGNFDEGGSTTFMYEGDGQLWYDADGEGSAHDAELVARIEQPQFYTFDASDFEVWS